MLKQLKYLYRALPPCVTSWLHFIPDSMLFGKRYRKCSPEIDMRLCGKNLKEVLDYAREHTKWGSENIPANFLAEDAEALVRTLPVVTSEELAAKPESFISDESNGYNSYSTTTGGSGRNPTSVWLSNSSYAIEWKHMHAIWGNDYLRRRDLKLTFRGYHLRPGELIRFDPIYNELSVDPFQLNDSNFGELLQKLQRYNVKCLHGYPSLISLFMERLKAVGMTFYAKLIFLGSEGASVELKRQLADFFRAKVVSWYGLTEKVVLAYDADMTGKFVNFSSYGYPWILNPDENGIGEIVGTTFVNRAMPLVNYRTGDFGRISTQGYRTADGIAREMLIIDQLQGRTGKDFLYGKQGEKFTMTAVNLHGEVQQKIVFYQIIQNEFGKIDVRVLPKKMFRQDQVCQELKEELCKRLKGFEVCCEVVKSDMEFVRSTRGKMIVLVQNLKH